MSNSVKNGKEQETWNAIFEALGRLNVNEFDLKFDASLEFYGQRGLGFKLEQVTEVFDEIENHYCIDNEDHTPVSPLSNESDHGSENNANDNSSIPHAGHDNAENNNGVSSLSSNSNHGAQNNVNNYSSVTYDDLVNAEKRDNEKKRNDMKDSAEVNENPEDRLQPTQLLPLLNGELSTPSPTSFSPSGNMTSESEETKVREDRMNVVNRNLLPKILYALVFKFDKSVIVDPDTDPQQWHQYMQAFIDPPRAFWIENDEVNWDTTLFQACSERIKDMIRPEKRGRRQLIFYGVLWYEDELVVIPLLRDDTIGEITETFGGLYQPSHREWMKNKLNHGRTDRFCTIAIFCGVIFGRDVPWRSWHKQLAIIYRNRVMHNEQICPSPPRGLSHGDPNLADYDDHSSDCDFSMDSRDLDDVQPRTYNLRNADDADDANTLQEESEVDEEASRNIQTVVEMGRQSYFSQRSAESAVTRNEEPLEEAAGPLETGPNEEQLEEAAGPLETGTERQSSHDQRKVFSNVEVPSVGKDHDNQRGLLDIQSLYNMTESLQYVTKRPIRILNSKLSQEFARLHIEFEERENSEEWVGAGLFRNDDNDVTLNDASRRTEEPATEEEAAQATEDEADDFARLLWKDRMRRRAQSAAEGEAQMNRNIVTTAEEATCEESEESGENNNSDVSYCANDFDIDDDDSNDGDYVDDDSSHS